MTARIAALTFIAMAAFAANTLLARRALGADLIDAAAFMSLRTLFGAAALLLIVLPKWRRRARSAADWRSAAMLALYMIAFSFAYRSVGAGIGAVIFFGVVQLTMIAAALAGGERFSIVGWSGLLMAGAGLVYLVSPGLTAPDPAGAALMGLAGVAWGFYSLLGRGGADPVEGTANNFLCAVPLVVAAALPFIDDMRITAAGFGLAALSGAITSGFGYVVWYAALKGLSAGRAATVQLSVPVLSALGGVVWLSEALTPRLLIAGVATLGGIGIVLAQRTIRSVPLARAGYE